MNKDFNKYFENTTLDYDINRGIVEKLLLDTLKYDFYGACVDGYYLPLAWDYLEDSGIKVVTVCGYPLGTSGTNSKCAEAFEAIKDGAQEIDAMMNMAAIKDRKFDYIASEVNALSDICHSEGVKLKMILETPLLTDDEIVRLCEIGLNNKVDFIRDSSGFNKIGATTRTVKLIKDTVGDKCMIKASGKIWTMAHALELIDAGADIIGTDAALDIMEEYKNSK
ncbi:MAG: deoxyribose-phosphate aldolase [Anaerovoracaceae bacterium]|nr:deoxyribose-phosphate aldolase [Anaerovoracaceae bacterium]